MFKNKDIFLLKSALLINIFGWGLSIIALVSSSNIVFKWLKYMGCNSNYDPKIDYWLRMSAFVFCWVGALSFRAFLDYKKQKELIYWLSALNIIGGIVLTISAFSLKIPIDESIPDISFCFMVGIVMGVSNYRL